MLIREADVVVIGAGPGGLSAALSAAQAGASVVVVEKNPEIGSPIRTTGGTFIEDMNRIGIPDSLWHPIKRIRFVAPVKSASFNFEDPMTCVLDVRGMLRFLAAKAVDAGVHISMHTPAECLIQDNGTVTGVAVKLRNRRRIPLASRVLIDASGYRGKFLRDSGVSQGASRFGVSSEYDMYSRACNQDEAVLVVGSRFAPNGYAWVFPWGKNRVRVGVGIIHPDSSSSPDEYLDRLVEESSTFGVDLSDAEAFDHHEGLFPSSGLSQKFAGNGIMGVGDSAGQGSALVGEGIRWAITAGQMAGEVAARSSKSGNTSAEALSSYEREWKARFGKSLMIGYQINKRRSRWSDADWNRKIERLLAMTPIQFGTALRGDIDAKWIMRAVWSQIAARFRLPAT